MLKWILIISIVALVLMKTPAARVLRLGDLPGDLRFQIGRFKLHLPIMSVSLIALFLWVLSKVKI